jgi:hypothetical protein
MKAFGLASKRQRATRLAWEKDRAARVTLPGIGVLFVVFCARVAFLERSWWWLGGALGAAVATCALYRAVRSWRIPPR